jgi:hypothetical protein
MLVRLIEILQCYSILFIIPVFCFFSFSILGSPIYLHAHPEQNLLNQTKLFEFVNGIDNFIQLHGIQIHHKRSQPFVSNRIVSNRTVVLF